MAKKVFVSGCYDLLHSGHVEFFQQASRYGDLYVGIGWIVGPLVGGQLLFSGVNIAIPYALVGIFVLSVALVLSRIKLPDPRRAHEADTNEKVEEKPMRVMAFGFGMLTLFLYVAAQTGVNSFFINYAEESILRILRGAWRLRFLYRWFVMG